MRQGIAQEMPRISLTVSIAHTAEWAEAGLGLAIASEVAKRHHLVIDVESRMGKGTTFKFTFPNEISNGME
ncbi:MAG: ATP-binding protein [Christensenellales bacterium]